MITEDYVSFETAKLLKEKGFDEACHAYYDGGHRHLLKFVQNGLYNNAGVVANSGICVGPTLQMAMKWLREVHKVDITVDPHEVEIIGYINFISVKIKIICFQETLIRLMKIVQKQRLDIV